MTGQVLAKLADSQLRHVLIALQDGDRAFNMRDVLDPWWCFERGEGFVGDRNDGGKFARQFNNPCPHDLGPLSQRFDWISDRATLIINAGEAARKVRGQVQPDSYRLVIDHSVPLAVITRELWRRGAELSLDQLRQLLRSSFKRAVLSREDDMQLRAAGLNQRMPSDWIMGSDPFARYKEAGITGKVLT